MKKEYDVIFVLLTYKNHLDLINFFDSTKNIVNSTYKVVIVNSFYDTITSQNIQKIANEFDSDFVEVENKGYGTGNNYGINYVKNNYEFEYLVISNPDIIITKFDFSIIKSSSIDVVAPKILTLKKKNQNPYYACRHNLLEYIYYISFKSRLKFLRYFPIVINKIERILLNLMPSNDKKQIYACHGSFFIINKNVFDKINNLFYEEMFLFAEENYIARLFYNKKIKIFYLQNIMVTHIEDGSIGKKTNTYGFRRESFIKYYEYWKKRGT